LGSHANLASSPQAGLHLPLYLHFPTPRRCRQPSRLIFVISAAGAMDELEATTRPTSESDSQKLQRLGFVQSYSEAAVNKSCEVASSVYNTTRGYVPAAVEDQVSWGEGKFSEITTQYGAPLVNTVQDKSQQILGIVDSQVRCAARSPCRAVLLVLHRTGAGSFFS